MFFDSQTIVAMIFFFFKVNLCTVVRTPVKYSTVVFFKKILFSILVLNNFGKIPTVTTYPGTSLLHPF